MSGGSKYLICFVAFIVTANLSVGQQQPKGEIIYQVFQRSFYDSNGDGIGDLNGVRENLDYLQELGVTSLLLLPLYESVYYHNYFAIDFERIDPEFGTMQDYIDLIKAVHRRGMKVYLDMEMQYVTEDQLWWKDSYGNPKSKYSDYILYDDTAHTQPESIVYGLTELAGYDGTKRRVATANLSSKNFKEYTFDVFKYFVDPNNDGKFDDGVDGFRLDHMMDDLDFKGRLKNLFQNFWAPLFSRLKQVNPHLKNVAEQAVWSSYGNDYFTKGKVDRVFAFNLQAAIASFNKTRIASVADSTFNMMPEGSEQVVFIENHDMQRFASAVDKNFGREKVGAALDLLLGGVPCIYYGQELGMFGRSANGKYGMTDANDIPVREAFEWYKTDEGKGMAIWYKNTGAWWDNTNLKPNDGVSLEEERTNPNSLLNYYRSIIRLRQSKPALINGRYETLSNNNDSVLSFRRGDNDPVLVVVNLSGSQQNVSIKMPTIGGKTLHSLWGNERAELSGRDFTIEMPAYAVGVWQIQ